MDMIFLSFISHSEALMKSKETKHKYLYFVKLLCKCNGWQLFDKSSMGKSIALHRVL